MRDVPPFDFGKFLPGFDFLQNLAGRGSAASDAASAPPRWVAPTLDVQELDKRIHELKAVLFWLEQNGTALKATIQALEVQRMTLAALHDMNLGMAEVAKAFTVPTAQPPATTTTATAEPSPWPFAHGPTAPVAEPAEPTPEPAAPDASAEPAAAPAPGLADPVQWWGALTQQFQQIAAHALQDAAQAVPPGAAEAFFDAAHSIAEGAAGKAAKARKPAKKATAKTPGKAAAKPARKATAKAAPKATAQAGRQGAATRAPAAGRRRAAGKSGAAQPRPAAAKSPAGWPLPPPFKPGR